uniref:Uncharacterized protein n=1 Tax=Glossina austeni TaxID=7395 RepID=A0A1A9VY79_GLOAU
MNVVHLVKSIIAAAMLLAYYILLCSGCTYEGVMLVFMLLVVLLLLLGDFVDVIDDVSSGGGGGGGGGGGDRDGDSRCDEDVCTGGEGDGGYYQLCTFTACCFAWWLVEQPYRLDIWLTGWSRDEWESFRTHILSFTNARSSECKELMILDLASRLIVFSSSRLQLLSVEIDPGIWFN